MAFFAFVRPNKARMELGRSCLASSCSTHDLLSHSDNATTNSADAEMARHASLGLRQRLLPPNCTAPHFAISHWSLVFLSGIPLSDDILGYIGRFRHARSEDTDISCYVPISTFLILHLRRVVVRGGCFRHLFACLFVCLFICMFLNTITFERLNTG